MAELTTMSELNKARQSLAVTLAERAWFIRTRMLRNCNPKIFWIDTPYPKMQKAERRHYFVSTSSVRHRVQKGRYAKELRRQLVEIHNNPIPTNPNDPF